MLLLLALVQFSRTACRSQHSLWLYCIVDGNVLIIIRFGMHEKKNNFAFSQLTLAFFLSFLFFWTVETLFCRWKQSPDQLDVPFLSLTPCPRSPTKGKRYEKREKKNEAAGGTMPAKML